MGSTGGPWRSVVFVQGGYLPAKSEPPPQESREAPFFRISEGSKNFQREVPGIAPEVRSPKTKSMTDGFETKKSMTLVGHLWKVLQSTIQSI